jgi:hypothetical protein
MAAKKRSSKWIGEAMGKPGALHEDLHIPLGQKIPQSVLEKAAKQGGTIGRRAKLALTLEGFHHDKGKSAKEVAKAVKHRRKSKRA